MPRGTEDQHSTAPAQSDAATVIVEQRDANEHLILEAIRAHEIIKQAESGWAAALVATRMAESARERAEAVVDEWEERAREGQIRLVIETTRRLANIEELQNANRLATIGKLTATMAHELGTPLAVITVRAQMIAAGEVPADEVAAEAKVILHQTQRMTRMVSEVLDLARPRAAVMATIDLAALGRQTESMLAPMARKRNVKLRFVEHDTPVLVLGDASRILQILTNLVINAAQSMTKPGAVTFCVHQRRACPPGGIDAEYIAVDVTDTGEGIPVNILPRIFDTFFTTKKEGDGTGLGLAVSKRIAIEHGGWIGVISEEGKGSRFTLYLPPLPPPPSATPQ